MRHYTIYNMFRRFSVGPVLMYNWIIRKLDMLSAKNLTTYRKKERKSLSRIWFYSSLLNVSSLTPVLYYVYYDEEIIKLISEYVCIVCYYVCYIQLSYRSFKHILVIYNFFIIFLNTSVIYSPISKRNKWYLCDSRSV